MIAKRGDGQRRPPPGEPGRILRIPLAHGEIAEYGETTAGLKISVKNFYNLIHIFFDSRLAIYYPDKNNYIINLF